jgi:hypothetical protein
MWFDSTVEHRLAPNADPLSLPGLLLVFSQVLAACRGVKVERRKGSTFGADPLIHTVSSVEPRAGRRIERWER